jgi:hypothetical protein
MIFSTIGASKIQCGLQLAKYRFLKKIPALGLAMD